MGVGRSQNVPVAQWIEQLPSKQWVVRSSRTRDATKLTRATAYDKIADFCRRQLPEHGISCQRGEFDVTKLSEALTAYRICAKAEGKSPRTIQWITSSVGYFMDFLGGDQDISTLTANDLRRFIIALPEHPQVPQPPLFRATGPEDKRPDHRDLRQGDQSFLRLYPFWSGSFSD